MENDELVFAIYNTVPLIHVGYITMPNVDRLRREFMSYSHSITSCNMHLKQVRRRVKRLHQIHFNDATGLYTLFKRDCVYGLRSLVYCNEVSMPLARRSKIINNNIPFGIHHFY